MVETMTATMIEKSTLTQQVTDFMTVTKVYPTTYFKTWVSTEVIDHTKTVDHTMTDVRPRPHF